MVRRPFLKYNQHPMAFLKMFKAPRHQQFSYKPRYWDPKKEEAEERRQRIETIQNGGYDGVKERIRGGFRAGYANADATRYRSQRVRRSNYSLLIVLAVLVLITYMLYNMYLPELEQLMG